MEQDNSIRLEDRAAITGILNSHCRGLDRCDANLLQSCYWPEAAVDYGSYKGPAHEFATLVVQALAGSYELTRHCIGNILVTFDGARARCESYVDAAHLLPGGEMEMRFGGRYLDLLEQRNGHWRMLNRQVVMDWSRSSSIADERDSEAFSALAKGRNDSTDPLHQFLGNSA